MASPRSFRTFVKDAHAGRSKHWIKIKNRKHDAFNRVQEAHNR
jgi:hypothetical protein